METITVSHLFEGCSLSLCSPLPSETTLQSSESKASDFIKKNLVLSVSVASSDWMWSLLPCSWQRKRRKAFPFAKGRFETVSSELYRITFYRDGQIPYSQLLYGMNCFCGQQWLWWKGRKESYRKKVLLIYTEQCVACTKRHWGVSGVAWGCCFVDVCLRFVVFFVSCSPFLCSGRFSLVFIASFLFTSDLRYELPFWTSVQLLKGKIGRKKWGSAEFHRLICHCTKGHLNVWMEYYFVPFSG